MGNAAVDFLATDGAGPGSNPCADDPALNTVASAMIKPTLNIGFTGTREGMTSLQWDRVKNLFEGLVKTCHVVAHLGDCVGADAQFYDIAFHSGAAIVIHPPDKDSMRAFKETACEVREAKPYLDRNNDIVDESDGMIACPSGKIEVLRSGTWATIRYSKKTKTPLLVYYPDGSADEY